MNATLDRINKGQQGEILQLTCVYGKLTPTIINKIAPQHLHVTDVASIQLKRLKDKVADKGRLLTTRMNAEKLGYKDNAFTSIILFFLLHEMPPEARRKTLAECVRILSVGGRLLYTEYGQLPTKHFVYRFPPSRLLLTKLEPFLASYWEEDILKILEELAESFGKRIKVESDVLIFSGFYRVTEFKITSAE